MTKSRTLWDKFWRDDKGHVVLLQWPNIPLWGWIGSVFLSKLIVRGTVHSLLDVVAFASLSIWAWLELTEGVSYLRRLLGLAVLVTIIWGKAH